NWDISLLGNSFTSPEGFYDIVSRFRVIYTDRLHVAIAGSMLGRDVFLLEGNYRKNIGVYKSSLKYKCNKTKYIGWEELQESNIIGQTP
ncbi:hypothetical protein NSX50_24400, partial [Salmonella enterica]|nr:hypothetical protein [Salmonella enterica]